MSDADVLKWRDPCTPRGVQWNNNCPVSPRTGQFTVTQVWNDSFYLQGLKLEVTQVVTPSNHNDLFAGRLQTINR